MKTSRRFRCLTVILSLWMLLFSQAALAGYFCQDPPAPAVAMEMPDGMPCAHDMQADDDGFGDDSALCHAHCQSDAKSVDSFQPPSMARIDDVAAGLTVALAASTPSHDLAGPQPPLLRRGAAPPLSVQHCCLRI
jgi:hypothetical protein